MRRQLKKSVVYSLYAVSFSLLVGGVIGLFIATKKVMPNENNYQYVSKGILDYKEEVKVVNTSPKIFRPYTDENINMVKSYYDYKAESKTQENSLIYYENTYMQSSGVSYSNGDSFNVVAILDGTVVEIKEDTTLGNVITIEHENGIVSVYQSISDIKVKENEIVTSGQLLAKSSTSNISTDLGNHLYFELIIDGVCVNPEIYFDKSINEIKG